MKYSVDIIFTLILQKNLSFGQIDPSIIWQNTIGGNGIEIFGDVIATKDCGCVIAGYSDSNISGNRTENSNRGFDYWVLKLSNIGEIEWQNTIGREHQDILGYAAATLDGGYIIGGHSKCNISGDKTEDAPGSSDFWVLKVEDVGNIEWQKTIGGYLTGGYSVSDISVDKSEGLKGGFDYWRMQLTNEGEIDWGNTIGGNGHDFFESMDLNSNNEIFLSVFSWSGISNDKSENNNGQMDFWVIKHSQELISLGKDDQSPFQIISFPYSALDKLIIKSQDTYFNSIKIYSTSGNLVMEKSFPYLILETEIDVSKFSSGIYSIVLSDNYKTFVKKIIKK